MALDKILERYKERYFLSLENQGAKLPFDYDTQSIKENPEMNEPPLTDLITLTHEIRELKGKIKEMQGSTTKKYYLEDIFPYPFDRQLNMIPFPKHCEILKFDRYNEKTYPIDHIREFKNMILEFAHEETYFMRFFP